MYPLVCSCMLYVAMTEPETIVLCFKVLLAVLQGCAGQCLLETYRQINKHQAKQKLQQNKMLPLKQLRLSN